MDDSMPMPNAWIRVAEAHVAPVGERPVYLLRREFDLGGAPTTASLRITAQGIYNAFINGVHVGDEELRPGFTQYAKRIEVQTYDATSLLRQGANVILVQLADGWFRGAYGILQVPDQWGSHVALLASLDVEQTDGAHVQVTTDVDWRVAPSHILGADLFRGQREDRRLFEGSAYLPGADVSAWNSPLLHGITAALVAPSAPAVRRVERLRPVSITTLRPGVHVVDFGQNINGWTSLSRLGPVGNVVTLTHGEMLDAAGDLTLTHLDVDFPGIGGTVDCHQIDEVISAGVDGDAFEPHFTTHGFQFVRVEGVDELGHDDIEAVVVHSDLRHIGGFDSSDDRLRWLHDATVWSFRDNACEVPTDCPTRERAGWTGDWQLFAPTAAYLFDVDAWSRRWLRDVMLDQHVNGILEHMSPAEQKPMPGPLSTTHGSAGWADVIVSAPLDLYDAYGSTAALEECWDAAERWMAYAESSAASGRHSSRSGLEQPHERYLWDTRFHFGEWLEPGGDMHDFGAFMAADKSEVATAYLHRSAVQMARIAEILGKGADIGARYKTLADGTRDAWQREFIDADGRLRVQTQASHVRALHFGLAPERQRATIAADLVALIRAAGTHLGTGFLSTPYLLPTLADNGFADVAFELLMQDSAPSWMYMRAKGATTIWEDWNGIDANGDAHASLNHYSKGAVISFLHHYVAGLRATEPGYRTFVVQPLLGGGIEDASTWLESPHGRIEVSWRFIDTRFELEVLVPADCTAAAVLPDGREHPLVPGARTLLECVMR